MVVSFTIAKVKNRGRPECDVGTFIREIGFFRLFIFSDLIATYSKSIYQHQ